MVPSPVFPLPKGAANRMSDPEDNDVFICFDIDEDSEPYDDEVWEHQEYGGEG